MQRYTCTSARGDYGAGYVQGTLVGGEGEKGGHRRRKERYGTVDRIAIRLKKTQGSRKAVWALRNGGGTRIAAHGDLAGESSLDFHTLQPPLGLLGYLLLVLVRHAQRHLSLCVSRLLFGTRY